MSHYLEVRKLYAGYGEVQVLWGIDMAIRSRGSSIGIIGSNGAGKTTLLKCIAGLIRQNSGIISLDGMDISRLNTHRRVKSGIVYVPAEKELFPKMRVSEVLEVGAYTKKSRNRMWNNLELVFTIFPRLKERRNQKAGTLSGGEQQMLTIGRALMSSPELLLLDEPSTGLSPLLVNELFASLKRLKEQGEALTITLVEQKVPLAMGFADEIFVMENGRIILHGDPRELVDKPQLKEAYLGGN
ncbi:MAG: ABC transporter ATP-binding protein [Candidatus Caldarchaeum sp.]